MTSINNIIFFIIIILGISCNNINSKESNSISKFKIEESIKLNLFDTIGKQLEFVTLEDTLKFSDFFITQLRREYQEIEGISRILDPQEAYAKCSNKIKSTEKQKILWSFFESQAGIDNFHLIYALILRDKNRNQKFSEIRENLLNILQLKNRFNSILNFGGTYYGHKSARIYADVEYEIRTLIEEKIDINNIPIEFNKKEYISQLRNQMNGIAKKERAYINDLNQWKKEPIEIINKLDILLTNYYYIKKCTELS